MTREASDPARAQRPAPEQHPAWCEPGSCTATGGNGHHVSPVTELKAMPPSPVTVAVRLSQGTPVSGFPLADVPLVHLVISDDEGELCDVPLYVEMARDLGRLLTRSDTPSR
jgi:hypothetical protein